MDKDTDILKWPLQCNTKFAYNVFHEVTGGPCILLNGLHFNSTHKLYTPFAFVSISLFHQAAGGDKNRWFYCPPTTYQKTYNIDKRGCSHVANVTWHILYCSASDGIFESKRLNIWLGVGGRCKCFYIKHCGKSFNVIKWSKKHKKIQRKFTEDILVKGKFKSNICKLKKKKVSSPSWPEYVFTCAFVKTGTLQKPF